ncbi:MAG: dihydrodipicolinate synthase family protein [Longimicrobiales bacterium]
MSQHWNGVFPAIPTQFREDLSIDVDATMRHLNYLIETGVHGMVVLGTIGENTSFSAAEKRQLLRAAVDTAAGRVPLLTGVAEFTTADACRYAADAAKLGADGLMVLPAMVYKADHDEAIAHYRSVAAASPLPILCYNNPAGYGVDLTPRAFVELADEPTIVAIKEASGDPRRLTDLVNAVGDRYTLFAGLDDLMLESVMLGATGTVFGLVCAFPLETLRMWEHARQGSWDAAREIYRWFMPLLHLDDHPKLVQYMKLVVQECGLGHERVRPPRLPVAGEERARVLRLIRTAIDTRPDLQSHAVRAKGKARLTAS